MGFDLDCCRRLGRPGPLNEDDFDRDTGGVGGSGLGGNPRALSRAGGGGGGVHSADVVLDGHRRYAIASEFSGNAAGSDRSSERGFLCSGVIDGGNVTTINP